MGSLSSEVGQLREQRWRRRHVVHCGQLHVAAPFPLLIWGYSSHRQYYMQNAKYHLIWEPLLLLISAKVFLSWANLQSHWGWGAESPVIQVLCLNAKAETCPSFSITVSSLGLGMKHLLLCFMVAKLLLTRPSLSGNTVWNEWVDLMSKTWFPVKFDG